MLDYVHENGASFFDEIAVGCHLLHTQLEPCLAELVSLGAVSSDNFLGLRALLVPAGKRKNPPGTAGSRRRTVSYGLDDAGRWSALIGPKASQVEPEADGLLGGRGELSSDDLQELAEVLLRRWGVVFRRLLDRETGMPPWRDLLRVLRRMEARGEIRGGRFISRFSGEQFALPEAVPALRKKRVAPQTTRWISVSAADPMNLVGILTPGGRVPSLGGNRILFREGTPVAFVAGGDVQFLEELDPAQRWEAEKRLLRRLPATAATDEAESKPEWARHAPSAAPNAVRGAERRPRRNAVRGATAS